MHVQHGPDRGRPFIPLFIGKLKNKIRVRTKRIDLVQP